MSFAAIIACHRGTLPERFAQSLDTRQWHRESLHSAPLSLKIPPNFVRAVQPPDWWGAGLTTGNLYVEVRDADSDDLPPALPISRSQSNSQDVLRWTERVVDRPIRMSTYREAALQPNYYVATATCPLENGQTLHLAMLSLAPYAQRAFVTMVRTIQATSDAPVR